MGEGDAAPRDGRYATVRVLLEDATVDTAREFFAGLTGLEIDLRLSDGLLYTASIETVMADE